MSWFSRRKALAALGTGISALAGCSSMGISNPFTGSIEVERIRVEPAQEELSELTAGTESNIVLTLTNPGGKAVEEDVTVSVDGEEVETLTVTLDDGRDHHLVEHTFEETGEYPVTAGDREKRVEITEEVDLNVFGDAGGKFAATPDGTRGIVTVWVRGNSESEFAISYEPTVEIDGEPVEEFRYDESVRQSESGEFEGELEPHQTFRLIAEREVEVDDTYEVTFDGESIGPVSLEREPVPTRYGETDRAGPSVPRDVVGYEPEIVERFEVEKPDGPDDYMDLEKMETVAVTKDRIYMRFRWGNYYHSLAAYGRWNGEEYWQESADSPADLVVFEGTEYLLDGGTLTARSTDGEERWQREVSDGPDGSDAALMVPSEDRLYVGVPDGVAVLDRASGDREALLDGRYPVLAGDSVYTWDGGTARRYERGSDEPTWTADLDRESTDEEVSVGHPHEFTTHGIATEDALVLVSHVRDYDDTRFLLHCFDGESGEERWTKTIVETIPESSLSGDKNVPAEAVTPEGSDSGTYVLPDVTQPVVVEAGGRLSEPTVFVGSTAGCRGYELESGEKVPWSFGHGKYPTLGRPEIGYFGSHDGLHVVPADVEGGPSDDGLAVEGPEMKWESHQITHQFGYDCLYLLMDGYVTVISGTVPEGISNAEETDD